MIQRHMKRPTEEDFNEFDFFNDAKDTVDWLTQTIGSSSDKKEIRHLQMVRDRIQVGFEKFSQDLIKKNRAQSAPSQQKEES